MRLNAKQATLAKSAAYALAGVIAVLLLSRVFSTAFPNVVEQIRVAANGYGLAGVFVVILLGSTLVPFSTDAFFLAVLQVFKDLPALTLVAIVASVIGGYINYFSAFFIGKKTAEKYVGKKALRDAKSWFDEWGGLAILALGAIPFTAVFDPLTFIAGMSRMDLKRYSAFMVAAKAIHFVLLAAFAYYAIHGI